MIKRQNTDKRTDRGLNENRGRGTSNRCTSTLHIHSIAPTNLFVAEGVRSIAFCKTATTRPGSSRRKTGRDWRKERPELRTATSAEIPLSRTIGKAKPTCGVSTRTGLSGLCIARTLETNPLRKTMKNQTDDLPSFFRPLFDAKDLRPYLLLVGLQTLVAFLGAVLVTSSSLF